MTSKPEDMQSLHAACSEGCLKKVKELIETEQMDDLNEPIQLAVKNGHLEIVKYMIKFDKYLTPSKVNFKVALFMDDTSKNIIVDMETNQFVASLSCEYFDFKTWTLLHEACRWGQLEIIEYLVTDCSSNPYGDGYQISPLDTACLFGSIEAVKYIFSQFPYNYRFRRSVKVYGPSQNSNGSIRIAITTLDLNTVKYIGACCAAAGGSLDVLKYFAIEQCYTYRNRNPLHMCCLNSGDVDVLKYLAKLTYDIKAQRANGFSCLDCACFCGNLEAVKYLVEEKGFDPCDPHSIRINSLQLAALNGHLQIIQYCIDSGCNPLQKTKRINTPLHLACMNGHIQSVRCLCNANASPLENKINNEVTPLLSACSSGHTDVVRCLIEEFHCSIHNQHVHGLNGIHIACANGHMDIVEMLCEMVSHTNDLIKDIDYDGNTPLMYAANYGHIKIIRYLILSKGCSINNKNKKSLSAYDLAKQNNHLNVCKLLEVPLDQHCAAVDCPNPFGCHELRNTCASGNKSAVLSLIQNKALRPQCIDRSGKNSLHYASQGGHLEIVKYLIESEACDPTSTDHMKQTALHHACTCGNLETVKCLTQYNKVDQCNKMGQNSLHLTCTGGSTATDIIEFFIEIKQLTLETISLKDTYGNTPLHYACQNGHLEIVKLFLTNNETQINVANKKGQFPHDMAWEEKHYSIIVFIVGLYKSNCDIKHLKRGDNFNLAHCACEQGDLKLVQYLIAEKDFDPLDSTDHGMNGLHFACMNTNGTSIVQQLALTDNKVAQVADNRGYTPLHYACQYGCKETVEFLLKNCQCNKIIDFLTKSGDTPLHIATRCNHLDIVWMLLSSGCKPEIKNNRNDRAYDIAIARKQHYHKIVEQFHYYFEDYTEYEVESYIKVFVVGDHDNGKSTLCRNLQESVGPFQSLYYQFFNVSNVLQNTAGVELYMMINSNIFGKIHLYDLAGHQEYYTCNAAFLEFFTASFSGVFIVVVKINKSINEIRNTIHEWISFIEGSCSKSEQKKYPTHIIIVGSYADTISRDEISKKYKNIEVILDEFSTSLRTFLVPAGVVLLDCRKKASPEKDYLGEILTRTCKSLRTGRFTFKTRLSEVYKCLLDTFGTTLHHKTDAVVMELKSLQDPICVKTQHFKELSDAGVLYYFEDENQPEMSWVIGRDKSLMLFQDLARTTFCPTKQNPLEGKMSKDTGVLPLSMIKQVIEVDTSLKSSEESNFIFKFLEYFQDLGRTIFCPTKRNPCVEKNIENTGVLPLSKRKNNFTGQNLSEDPNFIVKFLEYFQFCHRLNPNDIIFFSQKLKDSQRNEIQNQPHYYFPALVMSDLDVKPVIWQEDYEFKHRMGCYFSCLPKEDRKTFFPSRFLHVILLRLAFSYAQKKKCAQRREYAQDKEYAQEKECAQKKRCEGVYQRTCLLWKRGITWSCISGVAVHFELSKDSTDVHLIVACKSRGDEELECVKMLSELIHLIKH